MSKFPATYSEISKSLDHKDFVGSGTESTQPLFEQVGRVCAAFERIEDEVVLLFQVICGGPPLGISNMSRIIGVASSFRTKLDLVREAARSFLSHNSDKRDAVLAWLKLCNRASEIRNKVAHGHPNQLAYVWQGQSLQAAFLMPSLLDPRKMANAGKVSTDSKYCWNAEQLREYVTAFTALQAMMMTVREELSGIAEESQPHVLDPNRLKRD